LFQIYGSGGTSAVLPMVAKHDVPLLCPTTSSDAFRFPINRNIFNIKPSSSIEAHALVDFVVNKKKTNEIALFFQDDAFGTAGKQALQTSLTKFNLKRKGEGSYQRNTLNVEPALGSIMESKPGAVVVWGMAKASATFISKAKDKKFAPIFLVSSSTLEPTF